MEGNGAVVAVGLRSPTSTACASGGLSCAGTCRRRHGEAAAGGRLHRGAAGGHERHLAQRPNRWGAAAICWQFKLLKELVAAWYTCIDFISPLSLAADLLDGERREAANLFLGRDHKNGINGVSVLCSQHRLAPGDVLCLSNAGPGVVRVAVHKAGSQVRTS